MDNSFGNLVESANSILIILPTKPFFDQVAAGLSLYLALREKKEVSMTSPSPMTVEFNRLVGVNKVTTEVGNKNLVIKFADYKATDVERVSADVENNEFYLTVIPKPGARAPKKEQLDISYSGVSADLVILVGGANESHFPALSSKDLAGAKLAHVGTRALSVSPKISTMSFARPASSVSEVAATLIKESGATFDSDIATNLLLGIEEGSNKFSSRDVTAETFDLIAELLRAGGKRTGQKDETKAPPQGPLPGEELKKEEAPKEWLEPKIYKGTTIS